tara:strand:+ start:116 stop:1594 length:1479 start_codon:yes stop_codon:yes gene_type:complete
MSYKFSTGSVRRGDVYYEDDREGEPTYIDFGQDTITLRPSGSQILHAQADAVGIGTTSPSELLSINAQADGDECFIQFQEAGSDRAKIGINTSNNLVFHQQYVNKHIVFKVNDQGVTREGLRLNGAVPEVVINEQHGVSGDDSLIDFRVESENNTHMLFVSGGADRIGINTDSPDHTLSVAGDISASVNISASAFYGDGSNLTGISGGGGGSPAGADTQIQFNDGGANFGASSNLTWDDTTLTVGSNSTDSILKIQTTDDSSTAGPVFELTRLSASPADSDYLGQLKFVGKDDGNGVVTYAKITGKISDASNNSEDGIIEFSNIKNGSQTVTARLRSDSLQLLNGTNLSVDGTITGKMMHMTHHRYNDGSGTGKEYIPWAGTSEQNSPSWITQGVAPYNGRLLKVLIRSSKANPTMGNTIVGVHIGTDGSTVVNSTAEETVTVNVSNANISYTFNFANANHFAAGDVIGVSVDPTGPHGNVNVTCVWEYDIT